MKVFIIILVVLLALFIYLSFTIVKIEGISMYPTFRDGQLVFATRFFNRRRCKVGGVYVVYLCDEDNGKPHYIIKRLHRVSQINDKTFYYFLGDNYAHSYDSRQCGYFTPDKVIARVITRK